METPVLYNLLNQKKPLAHIAFLGFSLIVTLFVIIIGKVDSSPTFPFGMFIMLFLQFEVFIYLGTRLFAPVNFDVSPREITRIVIFRLLIFLTGCLLASMVIFILLQYAGLLISGESTSKVLYNFIHYGFATWFKSTIKGLSLGAVIFIFLLWQSSLRREQKLREENLIFQNETLKNQVNPHFLFNSLNTLSSLVSDRPEVADEFIHRLSAIYRYILEYSAKDHVPVNTELSFIKDYFFLHQIRDDGKIRLEINVDNTSTWEILPVSLQILVENAIKHNKATRESPLTISIYLENKHIVVKNNVQKMAFQIKSTQIGLRNLAQRVNLSTRKMLIIEETSADFIVKIPLLNEYTHN